jgi:hypothetical protein
VEKKERKRREKKEKKQQKNEEKKQRFLGAAAREKGKKKKRERFSGQQLEKMEIKGRKEGDLRIFLAWSSGWRKKIRRRMAPVAGVLGSFSPVLLVFLLLDSIACDWKHLFRTLLILYKLGFYFY